MALNFALLNERLERYLKVLDEKGFEAALIRNNSDLRWLLGVERVLDDEIAHTAIVSRKGLFLHTDSRYYHSFLGQLAEGGSWTIDMESVLHPAWAAAKIKELGFSRIALENTLQLGFYDELKAELAENFVLDRLAGEIVDLRMVKDAAEVELMKKAQSITDAAYEHIKGYIKAGQTELEIRAELENFMFRTGADALAFPSIIASGPNGANPHAQPGERKVETGDLIVLDYGAAYHEYHSDMTRTVCVGEASAKQREVYAVVRKAHEDSAAAVKPGCLGSEIHAVAAQVIADAGYGDYFGHGLGHGVGLEIHEQPNFSPRYPKVIPAGSVVTIEPGIYLPSEFGIRLEDFGLVTEAGYEPFTQSSHELAELFN